MLAGLVLLSTAVGLAATATAFAFSAPVWVALALYPSICSLTLLFMAALWSIRTAQPATGVPFMRPQA